MIIEGATKRSKPTSPVPVAEQAVYGDGGVPAWMAGEGQAPMTFTGT